VPFRRSHKHMIEESAPRRGSLLFGTVATALLSAFARQRSLVVCLVFPPGEKACTKRIPFPPLSLSSSPLNVFSEIQVNPIWVLVLPPPCEIVSVERIRPQLRPHSPSGECRSFHQSSRRRFFFVGPRNFRGHFVMR